MGRKAKKMNSRQAEVAVSAAGEAFQAFNSIYSLIYNNHAKNSSIVGKYHTVWLLLQRFLDLMELEVEKAVRLSSLDSGMD